MSRWWRWGPWLVAAAAVAVLAAREWARHTPPSNGPTDRAVPGDRRHGWCEVCGDELHGPQLHEVTDADVDRDGALSTQELMGGGTAMVAEFCADHCPGSCRHPHRPEPQPIRPDPSVGPNPFRRSFGL